MNFMKLILSCSALVLCAVSIFKDNANAQGSAGSMAMFPRMNIVDMPSARVIPVGSYRAYGLIMQSSGIVSSFTIAPAKNITFGMSYSMIPFLGEGNPEAQPIPAFEVKALLFQEKKKRPAIAMGLNLQGRGPWTNNRYQTLSPGAFISVSKNINWEAGIMSLHGGISYAIMPSPMKDYPVVYAGIEQSMYKNVTLSAEYIGTWNEDPAFMNQNGLMNMGLRYSPIKGMSIEIQARDLFQSRANANGFMRYAGIEYIGTF